MNAASTGHAAIVQSLLAHSAQPLAYNAFAECAYDVAAIAQHAHVCYLLETAERRVWAELTSEPYDPMRVHTTQLGLSVREPASHRAPTPVHLALPMGALAHRLSFFARARQDSAQSSGANTPAPFADADFSAANLIAGDPAPMTDSEMVPRRMRDIPLPHADSGMDWFWLSDWAPFVGCRPEVVSDGSVAQHTDRNGWQYSCHGFNSPETAWAPYAPSDAADCVRRRQWVRAMKRQVPLDDPTAVIAANPVLAKITSDEAARALEPDYLETARTILDATREISTSDAAVEHRLELEQTRSAVSVLLSNISTDENDQRRHEARRLGR
ncbi:hypothetical protein DL89DRAFT_141184 [Linderina pennispora]|uniref:Uncharacterized protein n=1 Tax=Linderina pennispora TaxID=61395 RepID=A0A1Y1WBA7_9FUNG|nr:uncharacterized protein DL89DRAFT_141184 [Linderina pennispora]ORX70827.1 hypothetical protein DL89DRAFT_141184 [Linderina pennispora]